MRTEGGPKRLAASQKEKNLEKKKSNKKKRSSRGKPSPFPWDVGARSRAGLLSGNIALSKTDLPEKLKKNSGNRLEIHK